MRKRRLLYLFILFLLPLVGVIWHEVTAGFHMQKVRFHLPKEEKWKCQMSEEEKQEVERIFSFPFKYLAKGRQSFVFVSHDDKYVLKLFRYHLVKPRFGLHLFRFMPSWNAYRRYRIKAKRKQFENWMKSYMIAYKDLKKETGILCLHVTETEELPNQVTVYDRIGRSFTFDPNLFGFLIQKKTDLLLDTIKDLVRKKQKEELIQLLSSYLDTVLSRHFKGINNKDPSWLRNMGSIDNKEVVEIDVGRYTYAPVMKEKKALEAYLHKYTATLQEFLSREYPEMRQALQKLKEEKVDQCAI